MDFSNTGTREASTDLRSGLSLIDHPQRRFEEDGRSAFPISGLKQDAIWHGLVNEPNTGVSIVTMEGMILFVNEQSARIFLGLEYTPALIIGKKMHELFPKPWVDQRLELFRRVLVIGHPMMIRTIWRGWQQFSWIHYIEPDPQAFATDDPDEGRLPDHFLVITRRISSVGMIGDSTSRPIPIEPLTTSDVHVVDSQVMDLGELEVLSTRELEVLALLGQGMSLKEIAKTLHRSVKTIDNHRQAIGRKLAVDDRVHLAEIAKRAGITLADAETPRV
jgi:DNA-binding CsgD family transcriptional regulator